MRLPSTCASAAAPFHPSDLARHACLGYAYLPTGESWRLVHESGTEAVVRPMGPLRANNADALTAALCAGLGIAVQPDFIYWKDVAEGRLETVMTDWALPPISLHLVAPGGGPRPARVAALMDYLGRRFSAPLWSDQ